MARTLLEQGVEQSLRLRLLLATLHHRPTPPVGHGGGVHAHHQVVVVAICHARALTRGLYPPVQARVAMPDAGGGGGRERGSEVSHQSQQSEGEGRSESLS